MLRSALFRSHGHDQDHAHDSGRGSGLRRRLLAVCGAASLLCLSLSAVGGGAVAATVPTATTPCGVSTAAPAYTHVVWIVMENKRYSSIVGSTSAPYLNRLATACGLATSDYAVAHPSLPNYIALTSGGTQGIADDLNPSSHPIAAASIFSQLGTGWRSLQESMPTRCLMSNSGSYAARHNPAAYYSGIRAACATQDVPLASTPDVSARFTFITPNLCHDMHDCSVQSGDAWLSTFLPKILGSAQYASGNTAVFVTWDEDDYAPTTSQRVATLVIAPTVVKGARVGTAFTHYSLLRTTEEVLKLPLLGKAATAASMRAGFHL